MMISTLACCLRAWTLLSSVQYNLSKGNKQQESVVSPLSGHSYVDSVPPRKHLYIRLTISTTVYRQHSFIYGTIVEKARTMQNGISRFCYP